MSGYWQSSPPELPICYCVVKIASAAGCILAVMQSPVLIRCTEEEMLYSGQRSGKRWRWWARKGASERDTLQGCLHAQAGGDASGTQSMGGEGKRQAEMIMDGHGNGVRE
jgi:hypothetical protein